MLHIPTVRLTFLDKHIKTQTQTPQILKRLTFKTLNVSAFFWGFTQHSGNFEPTVRDNLWVPYLRFKISENSWNSWSLKTELICCPETSVRSYQSTLRKIPEERRTRQHHSWSLKSRQSPIIYSVRMKHLWFTQQWQRYLWSSGNRDCVG